MIAKFVKVALLGTALACQWYLALAAPSSRVGSVPVQPSSPLYKNVLYVAQSTDLTSTVPGPIEARFGPLTTSKNGFGMRTNFTDVSKSSGLSGMPRINISGAQPSETVTTAAKLWMQTYSKSYFNEVKAYMLTRGISIAYFSYYQEVSISTTAGAPRKKGVMWSGTVDLNGRALYGDPRIVDADPIYLDIQYYPLATGVGVVANEGYPNGGKMTWRILNRKLQQISSGSTVVDVAGAYDDPEDDEGDLGSVSCFIDKRHPSCDLTLPSSTKDAATIANSVGASGIFAFYAQRAQLDYVQQGEDYVPKIAVSFDKRELNCTALKETVTVGKSVTLNGNLYYGVFNGKFFEYNVMDRVNRTDTVEPKTYLREATLTALQGVKFAPTKTLLSPFTDPTLPQMYTLENATDPATKDFLDTVTFISPLDDQRQAARYVGLLENAVKDPDSYIAEFVPDSSAVIQSANTGTTSVSPLVTATPVSTIDYEVGIGSTSKPGPEDNLDGKFYTRNFSFNVANKADIDTFLLTRIGYDDYFELSINGRRVINLPVGNMLAPAWKPEGEACRYGIGKKPIEECKWSGGSYSCEIVGYEDVAMENQGYDDTIQTHKDARLVWTYNESCKGSQYPALCPLYTLSDSHGCTSRLELGDSNREPRNDDLRGYLVNGLNTITLKLAVGGEGEGWIRLRTTAVPSGCPITP